MGRPPIDEPRTKILAIRLTAEEHAAVMEVAGPQPAPWARSVILPAVRKAQRAAKRTPKPDPT